MADPETRELRYFLAVAPPGSGPLASPPSREPGGSRVNRSIPGRSAVLVTGMSGTGKSAALSGLEARGHRVVDADVVGWIGPAGAEGPEPVWDVERVATHLDGHVRGALFVAGCAVNQRELYDRFDAVVLLSAPLDDVLARVTHRANPFGSTAADRARIAADLTDVEPVLRRGASHEIVTTIPLDRVVAALERIAAALAR